MRNSNLLSLAVFATLAGSSLASTPVTMAWARAYALHGQAQGITLDPSGNVYTLQNAVVGANNLWSVQKFDAYGVPGWNQTNYFLNNSLAFGLRADASNNVYVFGNAANTPSESDAVVYMLNKLGTLTWLNQFAGGDHGFDACLDIGFDNLGNSYALDEETVGGKLTTVGHPMGPTGIPGLGQAGVQMTSIQDVVGPGPLFGLTGVATNGGMFAELLAGGGYAFGEIEPTTLIGGVNTYYRYKVAFDPSGLLYVFKAKAVVALLTETDTYTIRAFDTNGNVVWSAGPFDGYLNGVAVPKANKLYYTANVGGAQTIYLRSQSGIQWSKLQTDFGTLVADDTAGLFFLTNPANSIKIDHLNEADGSQDWTTTYTPPNCANLVRTYTAVKGGALHIFGSYDNSSTNTMDEYAVKFIQGLGPTSVTLTAPTVTGSKVIGGTVKISGPAPAAGFRINLASTDPAGVGVPPQVVVPQGMTSVSFNCTCDAVDAKQPVNIVAKAAGCMRAATVVLNPNPLSGFTPASTSVVGGAVISAKVILAGPAGNSGRFVSLNSIKPTVASVPSSVYIAPGATSAAFQVTTHAVPIDTVISIKATSGGVIKTMDLTVKH